MNRDFETVSWQLQAVITRAQNAGQFVELLPTKKASGGRRWPPIIKRRVLIANRRCALFTATRISKDESKSEYNYVVLKASAGEWAEFNLYVAGTDASTIDVLIIPRGHLLATTSCALDNPELARYVNRWELLSANPEVLAAMHPIQWHEPKVVKQPSKQSIVLRTVICEAEKHGLAIQMPARDLTTYREPRQRLLISKRRCQVIRSNLIDNAKGIGAAYYVVSLPVPPSNWAEFLIFYVPQRDGDQAKYYVIPRADLPYSTSLSVNSRRLSQYEGAWNLLNNG